MKESNKDNTKNEIKHSLSNATIKPQDINKKLEIISEIPLFNDLSYGLFSFLNEELKEKHYKKNEYVIKQNDPINDIYLTIKGKFILTLNHQIEYDVEHDINTFINYQNITSEPFNNDRGYEILEEFKEASQIILYVRELFPHIITDTCESNIEGLFYTSSINSRCETISKTIFQFII